MLGITSARWFRLFDVGLPFGCRGAIRRHVEIKEPDSAFTFSCQPRLVGIGVSADSAERFVNSVGRSGVVPGLVIGAGDVS